MSASSVWLPINGRYPATRGVRRAAHTAPVAALPHFVCWAGGKWRGPWPEQCDRPPRPIWPAPFKKPQTAGVSKKVPYPCKNVHSLFRYALIGEREITEFSASPDVHRTYG